jgi:hypothetical protein
MVLTRGDVPAESIDRDVLVGDALAMNYQPVVGALFSRKSTRALLAPHSHLSPICCKPASTRRRGVGPPLVTPRNLVHGS